MEPKQYSAYPYFNIARKFGMKHSEVYECLDIIQGDPKSFYEGTSVINSAIAKAYLDEQERRAQV